MHLGLRAKLVLTFAVLGILFLAAGAQAYLTTRSATETAADVAAVVDTMDYVQELDQAVETGLGTADPAPETAPTAGFIGTQLRILRLGSQMARASVVDTLRPDQSAGIALRTSALSQTFADLLLSGKIEGEALSANRSSLRALGTELRGLESTDRGPFSGLRTRLADRRSTQLQTVAVLLTIALTALVVTVLYFNRLVVPLSKIYRELSRVNGGSEELEKMARGFSKMIARLRDDEFLAASLQERLLPDLAPNIPGLNIYARQRQARVVGGDWYDYHAMDGTLAFTIADSSGKGMSGALLSTVAMTALRSQPKTRANICKVLEQVNIAIESRLGGDNFVTMITGFADPVTGTVTIINCGHEPPLIYRARDNQWSLADHPSTMPLGINAHHFHPRPATITIEPGDRIFFYTDGLHDVRDSNRRFLSMEKIIMWLEELEQQPIQSGIETILGKTIDFAQGDIQDDITMLCIEFEPVSSPLEPGRAAM